MTRDDRGQVADVLIVVVALTVSSVTVAGLRFSGSSRLTLPPEVLLSVGPHW
jgi:hypothetical protein